MTSNNVKMLEFFVEQENYLRTIINTIPECVVLLGIDSQIYDINPNGCKLLGVANKKVVEDTLFVNYISTEYKERFMRMHRKTLKKSVQDSLEFDLKINNNVIPVEMRITPLNDPNGNTLLSLVVVWDVSERKKKEIEIQQLAYKDPLTDLYNRRSFETHMKNITASYRRSKDPFAVMIIDLDDFGDINNTLGHKVGDDLLVQLSERLKHHFRRETDFVARYGGDEFIVILSGVSNKNDLPIDIINRCKDISQSLVDTLDTPYILNEQPIKVTASIGIALCSTTSNITMDEILRRADDAMYNAKRSGKNSYSMHPVT